MPEAERECGAVSLQTRREWVELAIAQHLGVGGGVELYLYEVGLFDLDGAEDGHVGKGACDHGYLVAGVEAGAGLAVLVDFVGHGAALGDAEAEVGEELGQAGEEAGGGYAVVSGFV